MKLPKLTSKKSARIKELEEINARQAVMIGAVGQLNLDRLDECERLSKENKFLVNEIKLLRDENIHSKIKEHFNKS